MTFVLALLGGLAGLVLGWVVVATATIVIGDWVGASNFEGALAMGAIFGFGPIGGLVGFIFGAWLVVRYRRSSKAVT